MYCGDCGYEIGEDWFCVNCGWDSASIVGPKTRGRRDAGRRDYGYGGGYSDPGTLANTPVGDVPIWVVLSGLSLCETSWIWGAILGYIVIPLVIIVGRWFVKVVWKAIEDYVVEPAILGYLFMCCAFSFNVFNWVGLFLAIFDVYIRKKYKKASREQSCKAWKFRRRNNADDACACMAGKFLFAGVLYFFAGFCLYLFVFPRIRKLYYLN